VARSISILFLLFGVFILPAQEYRQGQLILKLNQSLPEDQVSDAIGLKSADYQVNRIFPNVNGSARAVSFGLERIYQLNFDESESEIKLAKALNNLDFVEYCEPRYLAHYAFSPNDPSFSSQLYLNQIKAPEAWDIERGDTNIIIAIVDAGIALNHPDLKNQIALNRADPINGLDDDNDGYVDNYYGWNLVDDNSIVEYSGSDHGVHVAGLASAETHNGIGVAGLGFNCKIMPLVAGKRIEVSHGYEAIVYAADHGADIINCSWGEYYPSFFGKDAVQYANNQGALVVGAAGNESSEDKYYPAAYDEVMAVVAVDPLDQKAGLSNYGFYMDIAAPGLALYSTTGRNTYNTRSGTSMSAPLVSAAAALVKSKYPNYSPQEIRTLLTQTADTIPSGPVNNTYVNKMGTGRLNVERALSYNGPVWMLENMSFSDANDAWFSEGDTLRLNLEITSLLQASSNLSFSISSASEYIQIIDSQFVLPALPLGTPTSLNDLFQVSIDTSLVNERIEFELLIQSGSIEKRVGLTISINTDYVNVEENRLKTSISSHGLIAYTEYPEKNGLGLVFESGASMLYEGGLMIAASHPVSNEKLVFDRLRGLNDIAQTDFRIKKAINPVIANNGFLAKGSFTDAGASNAFGLTVNQQVEAFDSVGIDACVVLEYQIKNPQLSAGELDDLYVGLAADFDIGDYLKNKAEFDGQRYLAYTYSDESADQGIYLGLQLLNMEDLVRVYNISAEAGGEGGVDIDDADVFTEDEKFEVLTGSKLSAGVRADGTDVFQVLTAGPMSLAPGDSLQVRFALHAATSLQELKDQADAIYFKYNEKLPSLIEETEAEKVLLYPNPSSEFLLVRAESMSSLELFDMNGRAIEVELKHLGPNERRLNLSRLEQGIYQVRIRTKSLSISKAFIKL